MQILFFVMAVTAGYLAGYHWRDDEASLPHQLEQQQLALDAQKARVYELKIQVVQLTQRQKIDDAAIDEVRNLLKEQQQASLELREEIAFYRGIVSPSEVRSGILIQRVELTPLAAAQLFHYQVVLTQVLKNERVARGEVEITLSGVFEGRAHNIPLQDLDQQAKKLLKFRFKYFQMFEGDLQLPDGFSPHSIDVVVKPRHSNNSINESFPWPRLAVEEKI
ncbi:hypothetical protein MNBD_GAMMA18-684 [hydrothermal vent metagenome]|uniref:Uncharacterized protein n=1 Tax=hydrothermal vent metagenome TaxID=652676 RepID=A0A3B0ZMI6_9ZZZZ